MASAKDSALYVLGRTDDITKHYRLGARIGQPGQFGYAQIAVHIPSGEERAVKVISKARFLRSADKEFHFKQLRAEIEVMKTMDHPNIIRMYDVFETDTELFIVMEFCRGGELFDRIKELGTYSEREASVVLRQICEGIEYMHKKHIAHCDLKPDNFLFLRKGKDSPIKIIDFGMAKFCQRRKYFKTICGTPYYVAPEVIQGQYNHHSDMWSFGVVMFVMLFGYPPFYADQSKYGAMTDEKIFEAVKKGFDPTTKPGFGAHFPASIAVSDSGKDLIARLLTRNIAKRLTATEALAHPWLRGETAPNTPIDSVVVQNLRKFEARTQFKQRLLTVMTGSLSEIETKALRASFEGMDKDGDGQITVDEMFDAFKRNGINMDRKEVEQLIKSADIDGDGRISYQELMLTAVNKKLLAKEERMWESFRALDKNGDGVLSAEEIMQAFGDDKERARSLIAEVDRNGDGMINYDEFMSALASKEEDL